MDLRHVRRPRVPRRVGKVVQRVDSVQLRVDDPQGGRALSLRAGLADRLPSVRGARGPRLAGLARNLPFLPRSVQSGVQLRPQRLQRLLPSFPDDVDLGVVGNRLERDVGYAFVDEPLPNIAVRGGFGRCNAGDLGFLALSLGAVGQQVPRIACAHDAGAGECQRDAGGVDGDPATPPLLGNVGGGAGATGGVKHQIARVGRYMKTASDGLLVRFDHITHIWNLSGGILPDICPLNSPAIREKILVCQRLTSPKQPVGTLETLHLHCIPSPAVLVARVQCLTDKLEPENTVFHLT